MDDRNPYAPSQATLNQRGAPTDHVDSGVTAWRYGTILVVLPDSTLPGRCVKCNEPADPPTKARKIYWHHPGLYALILINILLYAIVGAFVRKRAIVAPGLCGAHKKRRNLGVALTWCGIVLGIGLICVGLDDSRGSVWFALGAVLILGGAVVGRVMGRIVYAHKIEASRVWLKGCGADFLDSLPPLR
jgi:hypothetical protein